MYHWLASLQPRLRFFSEAEAWTVFRVAAIGEAVGWTLLISGLAVSRYVMHGNQDPIIVAGQLHGTLFLAYFAAALASAVSLGWSGKQTVAALAASVPPYGSLVFELWAARRRELQQGRARRRVMVWAMIYRQGKLLALQPASGTNWQLPGGQAAAGEPLLKALQRLVQAQIGTQPDIGSVQFLHEQADGTLEFFFWVNKAAAFQNIALTPGPGIDECRFILSDDPLLPDFIRTADMKLLPQSTPTIVWL